MRTADIARKTRETDIRLSLDLDGTGKHSVDTGVGFLNHMLELFSCIRARICKSNAWGTRKWTSITA